eukprot:GEMP01006459.1.p1 GENE.GEMP01006459.1~~GEMP01006459.1.p1  ORF type:complete len:753 (+),score=187.96 GEMP01006459.1:132-2390(+)
MTKSDTDAASSKDTNSDNEVPSVVGLPATQTVNDDSKLSVDGRSRSASASSSHSAQSSAPSVASKSHSRSKRRKVYIDSDASRSGSDEGYDDGRSDAESANKPCSGWTHDISFVDMLPQQFDVCGMCERTGVLALFQTPKVKDASYIRVGIHGTSLAVRECRRELVNMGALDVGRDPFSPGPGQLPMPTFRDMHGHWLNFCLPLPLMERVIKHADETENAFCIKMRTRLHVPEEQLGTVFMQGCLDDVMGAKKRIVVLCHLPVLEVNTMVPESWQHHPGTTVSDPGPPSPVLGGHFLSAPVPQNADVTSNASYEAPCHRKPLVLRPRKKSRSTSHKRSSLPPQDEPQQNDDVHPAEPKPTKRRRESCEGREQSRDLGGSLAIQKQAPRKAAPTRRISSESNKWPRSQAVDGEGAERAREKRRAADERPPARHRSRSDNPRRRRRHNAVHLSPARNSTHYKRDTAFPSPARIPRRRNDRSEAPLISPKKRNSNEFYRQHRNDSGDYLDNDVMPRYSRTRAAHRKSTRHQHQETRGRSRSPHGKHSHKRPMASDSASRIDEIIPRPRARNAAAAALKQQQKEDQEEERAVKKHKKRKREFSDSDLRSPAPDRRKKKKVKPKKHSHVSDDESPLGAPAKKHKLPQRRQVMSDVEQDVEVPKKKGAKKKAAVATVHKEEREVAATTMRSRKERINAIAYREIERAKRLEREDGRPVRDQSKNEIETKKRHMREKLSARKESTGKEPRKRNFRRGDA